VGSRRSFYCTSLGKAIAAHLPHEAMEELLESVTFQRQTSHTIVHRSQLRKALTKVRQRGYAIDDEETVLGARCVAAPVFDADGKVVAAISVSGPIARITVKRVPVLVSLLKEASAYISARLPRITNPASSNSK
jgi:DNA-binding IclR family transcriptional regulator